MFHQYGWHKYRIKSKMMFKNSKFKLLKDLEKKKTWLNFHFVDKKALNSRLFRNQNQIQT